MVDARNYLGESITADMVEAMEANQLVILSKGTEKLMRDNAKKLNFFVSINKLKKQWQPNPTTLKNLIKAWGHETENWLGKVVNISLKIIIGKNTIIGTAASTKKESEKPQAGEFGKDVEVPNKCSNCDADVTDKVKEYSIDTYKKVLCFPCQEREKAKEA